jgi:hypothetical protein
MSVPEPSRRALWLAVAGLSIVPVLGILAVVSMSDRDPKRRSIDLPSPGAKKEDREGAAGGPRRAPSPTAPTTQKEGITESPASPPAAHQASGSAAGGAEVSQKLAESRRIENTDPARSRQLLREILDVDPDNLVALERLSTKLLIDENHAEARKLAERCQSVGRVAACDQVASLAVKDSAEVQVLASAARKCLTDTPENLGCLTGMVNFHLIKGQVGDAAIYAGRLEQQAPQSAEAMTARGRLAAQGGRYGEARQLFESACNQGDQQACFRQNALQSEGW